MEFHCSNCGRTFACPEQIAFCPFCGTAYAQLPAAPAVQTTRIVIGSDSESRIQEKYWRMAHTCISDTLRHLDSLLPDASTLGALIDLPHWLSKQQNSRSATHFKKKCDALLQRFRSALEKSTLPSDAESIDIEALSQTIQQTCLAMLKAAGAPEDITEIPQLDYTPIATDVSPQPLASLPQMKQLLNTLEQTKAVVYTLLYQNGLFIVLSLLGSSTLPPVEQMNPLELSSRLDALSKKDYDPIFGEEYDELVQTFWESMLYLAAVINQQLDLSQRDENEMEKLAALSALLDAWKEQLFITLDETYQAQSKSMIDIYKALDQAGKLPLVAMPEQS